MPAKARRIQCFLTLCLVWGGVLTATRPAAAQEVASMWELTVSGSVEYVKFFVDGATDSKRFPEWKLTPSRLLMDRANVQFWPVRELGQGSGGGGTALYVRLVSTGFALQTEPADLSGLAPTAVVGNGTGAGRAQKSGEEELVDVYYLTARVDRGRNRGKRSLLLTVDLGSNHELIAMNQKIGTWSFNDKGAQVEFVDARLGAGTLVRKTPGTLTGRVTSADGDSWSLTLVRVVPLFRCETQTKGAVTLYSNNYIDDPRGAKRLGLWLISGKSLQLGTLKYTIGPRQTLLDGGGVVQGQLTAIE